MTLGVAVPDLVLVNVGYGLMLVALITRDILWLRLILIVAQSLLGCYGVSIGSREIAWWNFLFVAINTVRAAGLLAERRPLHLPRELETIYRDVFLNMSRREFLYLWEMGNPRSVDGAQLVREGEPQRDLWLMVDGEAVVRKGGAEIARLRRGQFVAEMSFLSGEPASADVVADGPVRCLVWPQDKLRALRQLNPHLLIKLQHVLGRDLTGKIRGAGGRR